MAGGKDNLTSDIALKRYGLAKAAQIRHERRRIRERMESGELSLADVIDMPVMQRAPLQSLLLALPHVGRATARKMMAMFGFEEARRLSQLGRHQKEAVVAVADGFSTDMSEEGFTEARDEALARVASGDLPLPLALEDRHLQWTRIDIVIERVPGISRHKAWAILAQVRIAPETWVCHLTTRGKRLVVSGVVTSRFHDLMGER